MDRRKAGRLALALACAAAVAACVVNLSFDMDQRGLALQAGAAGPVSTSVIVDLGSYPDIRSHKGDIRSLDLESVDFTITGVNSGTTAKFLTLTLTLKKGLSDPPEQDVKVGDLTAFPVMVNATRRISGNPALDAFLLERLNDGGTFYLLLNGSTDGKTDLVVDVNLHASMAYDTGFF